MPSGAPPSLTRIRATLRLLAILLWTAGWFVGWGTGTVLLLPARSLRHRWRRFAVHRWARGIVTVIGMEATTRGLPPAPPFYLATNHLSWLDILLLHSTVRGVFIARHDMRRWPVIGWLAQMTGTIWLDRTFRRDAARALGRIRRAIGRGDGVILFPEGTTSDGRQLLPMKAALLEWAARERFPVHCAALTYRSEPGNPPAREILVWWRLDIGFLRHAARVLQLRRFRAEISFGAEPVTAGSRPELLRLVQARITSLFQPVE
ncbi:MAG: lysophospholipid acyltransferase family protein [Gemmatimonadales bacterium]